MARAWKVCADTQCHELVPPSTTYCDTHDKQVDRARGTATQRGYTSRRHARFRKQVLTRDPICVLCEQAPSTVADHHPLSRRDLVSMGLDPDDPDRGRGLCKPCHDGETSVNQPGGWNDRLTQGG